MKIRLTLAVFAIAISAHTQNLVPNPSFENYKKLECFTIRTKYIPYGGDIWQEAFDSLLYDWTTPVKIGGVEIYSTLISPTCYQNTSCNSLYCTANPASLGSYPKDGYALCGISLINHYHAKLSSRSYVQTPLISRLNTGAKYLAGLYTMLPPTEYCGEYYCNNMGMLFTHDRVSSDSLRTSNLLNYPPQVHETEVNKDHSVWKKVFGCFAAKGDEQFLTIGNFYDDEHTKAELRIKEYDYGSDYAFYLVDSVFTEQIKEPFIPNVITPNGDAFNEKFVIKDIHLGWWALDIFNRWGAKVYHSDNYQNNWNGDNLSAGVYFYELRHRCPGIIYKGHLTILK